MIAALRRLGGIETADLPQSIRALGINARPGWMDLFSSHPPLEKRIVEGTFREDLFHRIAVLVLETVGPQEWELDKVEDPKQRERVAMLQAIVHEREAQIRTVVQQRALHPAFFKQGGHRG